jgi:hypothetical protein
MILIWMFKFQVGSIHLFQVDLYSDNMLRISFIFGLFVIAVVSTPLDDYVNAPDPTYRFVFF